MKSQPVDRVGTKEVDHIRWDFANVDCQFCSMLGSRNIHTSRTFSPTPEFLILRRILTQHNECQSLQFPISLSMPLFYAYTTHHYQRTYSSLHVSTSSCLPTNPQLQKQGVPCISPTWPSVLPKSAYRSSSAMPSQVGDSFPVSAFHLGFLPSPAG